MDYKKISYEALQRVSVSTKWTDDAIKRVADYLESALQNTASNSDYAKCSKCGCQIENPACAKCSFPTYDNTVKKHFA